MKSAARAFLAGSTAALGVLIMVATVFTVATLPPKSASLGSIPATVAYGAYHVHSSRSDGAGTVDDIAAAASRAGLAFVVLTDHGDGTRAPLAPEYRHGVLCIDAVEVNTTSGHVVALGLSSTSPFPMKGEAAGVIEDIHRQGGWAVLAHPDSPRESLSWQDWTVPYDGVEWLNVDAEWRDEGAWTLIRTVGRLMFRAPESLALLFQRPAVTLARWDEVARGRRVVGLAGLDAHARLIGWREGSSGEGASRSAIGKPSYEDMFRTLSQAIVLDTPLSGDAARDAARVLATLQSGRTFSIVRAMASPASLEFSATAGGVAVPMGGVGASGTAATFRARVPEAPGARVTLVCNGAEAAAGRGSASYTSTGAPTTCRVEVYYPGRPMPWIVSNAIGFLDSPAADPAATVPPAAGVETTDLLDLHRWSSEHDPTTTSVIAADGRELKFSFALGPGRPAGQYAAMAAALEGSDSYDRVQLTARADQPMRLWLQARLPGGKDGVRWQRSFYVDQAPRSIVSPLESFAPVDRPTTSRPIAVRIRGLLVVIDTVNSLPGRQGVLWLSAVKLAKAKP